MNWKFCIGFAPFSWGYGRIRTRSGEVLSFGPFRLFLFGTTFNGAVK